MTDVQDFQKRTGRKFPTLSEIYHVFRKRCSQVDSPLEALQDAAEAILILDSTGRITHANRKFIVATGLGHALLAGRMFSELCLEPLEVCMAILKAGQGFTSKVPYLSLTEASGSSYWEASVSPSGSDGVALIMEKIELFWGSDIS